MIWYRHAVRGPLLLLLAGSFSGILIAEGLLRVSSPAVLPLSRSHRFDPELAWVQKAGLSMRRQNEAGRRIAVEGTPQGIRRPAVPYDPNRPSLLVIGDSFTAATQVAYQDAWPAIVQRLLTEGGEPVQVINAGVDGYDLSQSYRLARRLWSSFRPRYLLLAVFVGNDILDYDTEANARTPWQKATLAGWLHDHSYLYHMVQAARRKLAGTWEWQPPPQVLRGWNSVSVPAFASLDPRDRFEIRRQFAATELAPYLKDEVGFRQRIDSTIRMVGQFRELAQSHQAGFGLLIVPTKQQVVPAQFEEWRKLHDLTLEQALAPQTELLRWAAAEDIEVLDATPVLQSAPDPEALFWKVNMHLAYPGHQVMGGAVAKMLAGVTRQDELRRSSQR